MAAVPGFAKAADDFVPVRDSEGNLIVSVPDPEAALTGWGIRPAEAHHRRTGRMVTRGAVFGLLHSRVDEAFQKAGRTWSDYKVLHVDIRLKGEPWGFGEVFPDPFLHVAVLEKGRRLTELVSRGMELAANQVGAQFRPDYLRLVQSAFTNPPRGMDIMDQQAYVRRVHRLAMVKAGYEAIPFHDEVRLVFKP